MTAPLDIAALRSVARTATASLPLDLVPGSLPDIYARQRIDSARTQIMEALPALLDAADRNAALLARVAELEGALRSMTEHYVQLAGCGDCGNWNPEEEPEVISARATLTKEPTVERTAK